MAPCLSSTHSICHQQLTDEQGIVLAEGLPELKQLQQLRCVDTGQTQKEEGEGKGERNRERKTEKARQREAKTE